MSSTPDMTPAPEEQSKKPRKWSRQTRFKMRRTALMKNSAVREAVTRSRVNRIVKQQTQDLVEGKVVSNLYSRGFEKVSRISKGASEATAQLAERYLMKILADAGEVAKHAGRVTIKKQDLALAIKKLAQ